MNKLTVATLIAAASIAFMPAVARPGGNHSSGGHSSYHSSSHGPGEHLVSGYTTKNGTYVAPYYATSPNGTRNDNYSTRGNVNPHTGEEGTKPRDEDAPQ